MPILKYSLNTGSILILDKEINVLYFFIFHTFVNVVSMSQLCYIILQFNWVNVTNI